MLLEHVADELDPWTESGEDEGGAVLWGDITDPVLGTDVEFATVLYCWAYCIASW